MSDAVEVLRGIKSSLLLHEMIEPNDKSDKALSKALLALENQQQNQAKARIAELQKVLRIEQTGRTGLIESQLTQYCKLRIKELSEVLQNGK